MDDPTSREDPVNGGPAGMGEGLRMTPEDRDSLALG